MTISLYLLMDTDSVIFYNGFVHLLPCPRGRFMEAVYNVTSSKHDTYHDRTRCSTNNDASVACLGALTRHVAKRGLYHLR